MAAILGKKGVKVLDCSTSFGRQPGDCPRINFLKSHIKGAIFLDFDYVKNFKTDLPFMLPPENEFKDTMKRLNIKLTDQVVCYDNGGLGLFAYRVAWMFTVMGHPNVKALAGGFAKWNTENRPVESTNPNASNDDFGYKLNPDKIKLFDQMKQFNDDEGSRTFSLIDARAPNQFDEGHIHGSVNLVSHKFFEDPPLIHILRPIEKRKQIFEDAGVDTTKSVTFYCRTGMNASLAYIASYGVFEGQASVYDGSWTEFTSKQ